MTWETFLRLLGEASLNGGILICLLALARPVIHRLAGARVMHWLWLMVAVHQVVFDLKIGVPLGFYRELPTALKVDASVWPKQENGRDASSIPRAVSIPRAPKPLTASALTQRIAAVWAGGALAMLAVLLGADGSFRRRLRAEGTPPDERTRALVAAKAEELGLRRVQTWVTDLTPGPAVFGLWRPRLLLPRGLAERLDDTELRLVLLHELGHLKRGDLWQQAALLAALTLHWFNPLVWLAVRLARADRELACDEFVLEHAASDEAPFYDKTLLRVMGLARPGRPALPAAGILETKTELEQRLHMIHQHQPFTRTRALCGAAFLFALGTTFLTAEGQTPIPTPAAAPTPAAGESRPTPASSPSNAEAYAARPDIMVQCIVISMPGDQAQAFVATHHLNSEAARGLDDLQAFAKEAKKTNSAVNQANNEANPSVITKSGQSASNTSGGTYLEVEPVLSPSGDKIDVNICFRYNVGQIKTAFTMANGGVKFLGAFDSNTDRRTTYLMFVRATSKE